MKKITEIENLDFKHPLSWDFSKKKSILTFADTPIAVIKPEGKSKASFEISDREFRIRSKGYWNNNVTISENGNKLATIRRSFGGKTFAVFENGNTYQVNVKNNILVRLTISSAGQKDLISYRLLSKRKGSVIVTNLSQVEDSFERLLLIILSGYIYRTILKELNEINLKELSFSAKLPVKE